MAKDPEKCKHENAEEGKHCPDCGAEVEGEMSKFAKEIRDGIIKELEERGVIKPKPTPVKKPRTLREKIEGKEE